MIERQKEKYGWEFLFLGANIDAAKEAARFGIGADRAANYHADRKGTGVIYEAISEAVCQMRNCSAPLSADWKESVERDYAERGNANAVFGGNSGTEEYLEGATTDEYQWFYNVYELALPDAPATALTLGGEEVALTLGVEGEGGDQAGFFTASLLRWARSGEEESPDSGDPDTLLLAAEPLPADDAGSERVWRINGAVLRKLYNSDVRYLLLDVDGAMLSLPTQGFVAGTRYAELKMQGASTAEFTYEIRMRSAEDAQTLPFNRAPGCAAEIWVEVAGERFELIDRLSTPEMYPCDVYCAPDDLPD